MVEEARLESVCTGYCTESSNLSLSAIFISQNKLYVTSGLSKIGPQCLGLAQGSLMNLVRSGRKQR